MQIQISQRQVQKTVLAPVLQQSIEVLLLPVAELQQAIELELQNNPVLEIEENPLNSNDIILDVRSLAQKIRNQDDDRGSFDTNFNHDDDDDLGHKSIAHAAPLEDYLFTQLHLELNDPLELKIGELIISNLDEDGYFRTSCEEIAQLLGLHEVGRVKQVLSIIQNFEPLGVASRNLRECLTTQVYYKYNGKSDLIVNVINNCLEEIGRKQYLKIASQLKISLEQVKDIAKIISTLEPKPARKYRPIDHNPYVKADLSIKETPDGGYQVIVNSDYTPVLKVNKFYKELLRQNNRPAEEIAFIEEKIKSAYFFIKSIEQRNTTIKDIAQYILEYQGDFFRLGHSALKPMVLRDVAGAISRNESTVSRAISGKYVDTPKGLFALKYFFSQAAGIAQSVQHVPGNSIKEEIKNLIEFESKSSPLSDQEIRLHFERKQIPISRRTITKYRQALKILPSNLRKV